MTSIWLSTLASVLVVSGISLIGVLTLAWGPKRLHRITDLLVSFAVGGLLGDALLHLLPEAFARAPSARSVCTGVLVGMGTFFLLERLLRHRLYHLHEHHSVKPLVWMNLLGDGLHNFVDGVLIAASWATGDSVLGVTTTVAVVLHEVPQEIGDFGVLLHGGLSIRRALTFNLLSALTAVIGAALVLLLPTFPAVKAGLIPFTAGGFLYIAAADLIPELQHEDVDFKTSMLQVGLIGGGVGVMALFLLFE